jgi:hypothetical protein
MGVMMKKTFVVMLAVLLLVVCSCSQTLVYTAAFSEQPNTATYKSYFTDMGIGKMANVEKPTQNDLEKGVNVFKKGEQICLYGTTIKKCLLQTTYYDIAQKTDVKSSDQTVLAVGAFTSWTLLNLPAGIYELEIKADSVLVKILVFEIKE